MSVLKGQVPLMSEPREILDASQATADRLRARGVGAGRWFAVYLALAGVVAAAWVLALELATPDLLSRGAVAGLWVLFVSLGSTWAERHAAYPAGSGRLFVGAATVWFGAYVLLVGPLVRWQFGTSLLPWLIASVVMALPYFVAAAIVGFRR